MRWPRLPLGPHPPLVRSNATRAVSDEIRALMRESAQPVALVTTFLPPSGDGSTRLVHGATLSSFSSISLTPPLLSFAMQTPSRLSEALHYYAPQSADKGHFVLNLLASHQSQLAQAYAQPGLEPFALPADTSAEPHPLDEHEIVPMAEAQGVPRLTEALGAFACRIVDQINLSHYSPADTRTPSILYIAQIVHVVRSPAGRTPLLYHHQKFVQPNANPIDV